MGILPLTSKLDTGTYPVELSIPMSFTEDTVGKEELTFALVVVEELKVEGKKNLFAIFPIGATMQDGGKRKRSDECVPLFKPTFINIFLTFRFSSYVISYI